MERGLHVSSADYQYGHRRKSTMTGRQRQVAH
jgi:hypothetical protein